MNPTFNVLSRTLLLLAPFIWGVFMSAVPDNPPNAPKSDDPSVVKTRVEPLVPTFLGNRQRNFYGQNPPDQLNVAWRKYLGKGKTVISRKIGEKEWKGAGWTGQPLLVREDSTMYVIQGAYDHHLRKIRARDGQTVWKYKFDDVVKGTGTLWHQPGYQEPENRLVILQGSRLGIDNYLDSDYIPSFRAISYFTGKELWRMNVGLTRSYSRDVDGSALMLRDTAYLGLENSRFTVFNPDYRQATRRQGMLQPEIYHQRLLYEPADVRKHDNNVVTESSPALLNGRIYVTSGSGHVYGYDLKTNQLEWDFYIGSDMDGSAVVTSDSCLLVSVEKQYISGRGGVFKLDPSRKPENAVVWYYPVPDAKLASWKGGVIGSVGVNHQYAIAGQDKLAAFVDIDGSLHVVNPRKTKPRQTVLGPDSTQHYPTPRVVFQKDVGPSISTPVFFEDKLLVASYDGLFLFGYDRHHHFVLRDHFPAPFEATPVAYDNKIYIASRNGYLYCFSD